MSLVSEHLRMSQAEEGKDYCIIHPPEGGLRAAEIDTYDDHRMAMAFSLAACGGAVIIIKDPGCVRKTYPHYFKVLDAVSSNWVTKREDREE